jgi:uncharacterized membrane protein YfcA
VATSLGVLAIVSSGSALLTFVSGDLNTAIAVVFSAGSLLGLLLGKAVEKKLSGPRVTQVFAIFTFLVALSLIFKAF